MVRLNAFASSEIRVLRFLNFSLAAVSGDAEEVVVVDVVFLFVLEVVGTRTFGVGFDDMADVFLKEVVDSGVRSARRTIDVFVWGKCRR